MVILFSAVLCLCGVCFLKSNDRKDSNTGIDEILLYFSMLGVFGLCISSFSSAVYYLSGKQDDNKYAWLKLTTSATWVLQAAIQSCFIAMALHRKPKEVKHVGGVLNIGYLALVLLFFNFGMWLLDTIDLEGHYRSLYSPASLKKLNELENNLFGQEKWTWIMLIFYPLAIFFRIHSVSTLYHLFKLHKHLLIETQETGPSPPAEEQRTGSPQPAEEQGTGPPQPAVTGPPQPAEEQGTGPPQPAEEQGTGPPQPAETPQSTGTP
ncbi:proton channel OTOP1-like [Corticium candelabrum]|uniref:proton channel OTOP1-like n=1 Tax=Corticium candelabrum TaxID=121492 RepID=UPI002E2713FD|nr:proton channel OTOP1-like [Corticium candelabrum]